MSIPENDVVVGDWYWVRIKVNQRPGLPQRFSYAGTRDGEIIVARASELTDGRLYFDECGNDEGIGVHEIIARVERPDGR